MIPVDKILNSFEEFPTLPTIYTKLSELMRNPNSTFKDAARIISGDQAAASKVLKVANSALFGIPGRVENVSMAISYLGFEEIKNITLAMNVFSMFNHSNSFVYLNPLNLWKHSISVAVITRILGKELRFSNPENLFISGILHDIGKLFFYKFFNKQYAEALEYSMVNRVNLREAEYKILGMTHTVVGELIAEKWKLPTTIKNCIGYHNKGFVDGCFDRLSGIVHVADIAAHMLNLDNSYDSTIIPKPNKQVWEYLNPDTELFTRIYPEVDRDYFETSSILLNLNVN